MKSHVQGSYPSEHGAKGAAPGLGLIGTLLLILVNLVFAGFALTQHLAWRFGFARELGPPAFFPSAHVGQETLYSVAIIGVGTGLALLLYRQMRRFAGLGFLAGAAAWVLTWGPVYAPYKGLIWLQRALEAPGYDWASSEAALVLGVAVALSMAGTAAPALLRHRRLSGSHGTAGWSDGAELQRQRQGIVLGRKDGRLLHYQGGGHLMTVAPTRSGKGVGAVIPNLLSYEGSALVTDPKGENYAVTASYRGRPASEGGLGQKIYALDPFEHVAGKGKARRTGQDGKGSNKAEGAKVPDREGPASKDHLARFNPLDIIEPGAEDAGDDANMLAGMLVPIPPSTRDEHFYKEAQQFLAGLILYVAGTEEAGTKLRSLPYVRELLMLPVNQESSTFDADYFDSDYEEKPRLPRRAFAQRTSEGPVDLEDAHEAGLNGHGRPMTFEALLADMSRRTDLFSGRVASAANQLSQKAPKERSGVISTAQQNTNFIETPRMKRSLCESNVRFSDLKTGRASIYLILPTHRMDDHKNWLRLMISCAITATVRTPGKPDRQILFLLDEFANLGRMRPVTRAYSLMAGYGMSLWIFLQDLSQLKGTYPRKWESFTANADVLQAHGNSDLMTAKHVSELIGKTTIFVESQSRSSGSSSGGYSSNTSKRYSEKSRQLVTPDEVRRFPKGKEILLVRGANPIKADKIRYYEEKRFSKRGDKNPMYAGVSSATVSSPKDASASDASIGSASSKDTSAEKSAPKPLNLKEALETWTRAGGAERAGRTGIASGGAKPSGAEQERAEQESGAAEALQAWLRAGSATPEHKKRGAKRPGEGLEPGPSNASHASATRGATTYLVVDVKTTAAPETAPTERGPDAPRTGTRGAPNTQSWPRALQIDWILLKVEAGQRAWAAEELAVASNVVVPDGFEIPYEAEKAHGISAARARHEGLQLKVVLDRLREAAEQADCLAGHNAAFDLGVLRAEYYHALGEDPLATKPTLCTRRGANGTLKSAGPGRGDKPFSLEDLHEALFDEKYEDADGLAAGARACARCLVELIRRGQIDAG